ncbi:hypothetical protein [Phenylobacterium sp.]|uniref:hypothetical protein n=1 Tax=Phenylobacterium sp. TaxID=1871053 RepID=UPI002F406C9D
MAVLLTTASLLTTSAHGAAVSGFECVWQRAPAKARATLDLRDPVPLMQACDVSLTGDTARLLGLYFSARRKLDVTREALQNDSGLSDERLAALVAMMGVDDRAAIMEIPTHLVLPEPLAARLRQAVAASGIPESDLPHRQFVIQYIMASVMVDELTH